MPRTSKHYKFRVVDLPAVKAIQVTYHYPRWTGMKTVSEEQAGDLRALEGTDAELSVTMTSPLKDGMLSMDGAQPIQLLQFRAQRTEYRGTIHMEKDGAYHVAATDAGPAGAALGGLLHLDQQSQSAARWRSNGRAATTVRARSKRSRWG